MDTQLMLLQDLNFIYHSVSMSHQGLLTFMFSGCLSSVASCHYQRDYQAQFNFYDNNPF